VSRYQKGKTNLDFTEARDSEWQWHQLGHTQVCTSLQTDSHASTPPLGILQAGCPSCRPTNSAEALNTFEVEQKSALREARLAGPERHDHVTTGSVDVDDLSSEGAAVAEESAVGGRDRQVVVASASALDVQLEVEQGDANRLPPLHVHRPAVHANHSIY